MLKKKNVKTVLTCTKFTFTIKSLFLRLLSKDVWIKNEFIVDFVNNRLINYLIDYIIFQ
jgi:hypothetical protein